MDITLKSLLVSATLLFSSISQAGLITDTVTQKGFVDYVSSYSYQHDLNDNSFTLGSALSATLAIDIYDDAQCGGFECFVEWIPESAIVQVEAFDFDSGGFTFGSFLGDLEINGLIALNTDGFLDITVRSVTGDFWVGNSTLTVVTADAAVPEPSIIALFGLGLLGLGLARRKVRS